MLDDKRKTFVIQASQALYIFGIAGPFTYFFAKRVAPLVLGPVGQWLDFFQMMSLLIVCEVGLLIGCAYATFFWVLTMRLFLTPGEIRAHLSEPYVPGVSEGVLSIFNFVCKT